MTPCQKPLRPRAIVRGARALTTFALVYLALIPGPAGSAPSDPRLSPDSLAASRSPGFVLEVAPGLVREARADRDSVRLAKLLLAQGRAMFMLGSHGEAGDRLLLAIKTARSARDTLTWMTSLGFYGLNFSSTGRFDEGVAANQERLRLALKTRNKFSEAWSRSAIAYAHFLRGDLEEARPEYSRAADLFHELGAARGELTSLVGLGRVLTSLGEIAAAKRCFERVLTSASALQDTMQAAHALNNLAVLEYEYGDPSIAVRHFAQARDFHARSGSGRGAMTAATNVALCYGDLGEYEIAADSLLRVIERCERSGYADELAHALAELGTVRLFQQRPRAAAGLYRRALAAGDSLGIATRLAVMLNLARALDALDSLDSAVEVLSDAERQALRAGEEQRRLPISLALSKCLRRLGRPEEGMALLVGGASDREDEAIALLRAVGEIERSRCFAALGRNREATAAFWTGIGALDKRRSLIGAHEWREAYGNEVTPELVDAARVLMDHPREAPYAERIRRLFEMLQRHKTRTLLERITEPVRRVGKAAIPVSAPSVTLAALQRDALRDRELFLDFFVGTDKTLLFAVTADSVRLIQLPGERSELAREVRLYNETIQSLSSGLSDGERVAMQRSLGQKLLGGVADLIAAATHVSISTDSYLAGLPFATLALPRAAGGSGGMLLQSHSVRSVPSGVFLALISRGSRERGGPGASGVAVTSERADLRGAKREAAWLARRFRGFEQWSGARPGEPPLEQALQGRDVLHFATHAYADDQNPWRSGVLVHSEKPGPRRSRANLDATTHTSPKPLDPYLRAGEIAVLRSRARLAVLSACETARGRFLRGEGAIGLTSAWLVAGVPTVVASLWPVPDRETARLMRRFYEHMADGESVDEALRSAQLEQEARPETHDPFYWAGFIVVGAGDTTIPLERTRSDPWALAAMGMIAAIVATAWAARRVGSRRKSVGV